MIQKSVCVGRGEEESEWGKMLMESRRGINGNATFM